MEKTNTIFADYPDVVSISQLKEMLGIGKSVAYRLVQTNKIKSFRIGRIYKIPKKYIIDYILQ